jgi:uncharacterized tellurite resistance protein B-like protein
MSIWTRIADAIAALARGESLSVVFDRLRADPAPEQSIGFTIAVLALGAKMAKADGQVTRTEVTAFREVFLIPESVETNAARVFNLARQDVAGALLVAARATGLLRHASTRTREASYRERRTRCIGQIDHTAHDGKADHHQAHPGKAQRGDDDEPLARPCCGRLTPGVAHGSACSSAAASSAGVRATRPAPLASSSAAS